MIRYNEFIKQYKGREIMKTQLGNEFFAWLFILLFFIADTAFFSYALSSKNYQAKLRKSVHSEEDWNFLYGFLWLGFLLGIIVCFICLGETIKAHSAWVSYVEPWKRSLIK